MVTSDYQFAPKTGFYCCFTSQGVGEMRVIYEDMTQRLYTDTMKNILKPSALHAFPELGNICTTMQDIILVMYPELGSTTMGSLLSNFRHIRLISIPSRICLTIGNARWKLADPEMFKN
jgi:hypothetical protein